jgi:hypothetical protein
LKYPVAEGDLIYSYVEGGNYLLTPWSIR